MKNKFIEAIESQFKRAKPLPDFKGGDTVAVWVKIQEGLEKDGTPKYRLQSFEGVVIRYRKGTTNATFLVRKMSAGGIGVERNFFVHSPLIDRVDVKVLGKVRRSRIYYLRQLRGKSARIESRYVPQQSTASQNTASV
jgi:large subunit ribosomal protein L19